MLCMCLSLYVFPIKSQNISKLQYHEAYMIAKSPSNSTVLWLCNADIISFPFCNNKYWISTTHTHTHTHMCVLKVILESVL